jgi:hypothetical protein
MLEISMTEKILNYRKPFYERQESERRNKRANKTLLSIRDQLMMEEGDKSLGRPILVMKPVRTLKNERFVNMNFEEQVLCDPWDSHGIYPLYVKEL